MKKLLFLFFVLFGFNPAFSTGLDSLEFSQGTPPRIIRTCCAFGANVGIVIVPFLKYTDLINVDDIGTHHYLGGKSEKNGIVYTYKGGFLDIGHLRDQSDWTAYFHSLIMHNRGNNNFELVLGREGGQKKLRLFIPEDLSNEDAALLGGRIAYDLSVWHEIATWYGVSTVPFVPERYSSFSAEDDYSNQLGVVLGIQSVLSDEPFDEAMAHNLSKKLEELQVAKSLDESYRAMEAVNGLWWSSEYKFPSKYFLLEHEIASYDTTYPLLVPKITPAVIAPEPVEIAKKSTNNIPLDKFYTLEFELNNKIPYARIFHEKKSKRIITNSDFALVLENIHNETKLLKYRKLKRIKGRKNQWGEID